MRFLMCLVSGMPAWRKCQQNEARERKFASCSRQANRIVDFSISSVWSKGILAFRRDSRGKSNGRRWQNTAAQRPSSFHHNFREWDKLQHLSPDPRTMPWELQPSLWLNPLGSLRAGVVSGEPSCNWPLRHWLAVLINKSFCAAAEPTFTDTLRTEKGRPSGSPSSRGMDVTMNSPFSSIYPLSLSLSLPLFYGYLLARWKLRSRWLAIKVSFLPLDRLISRILTRTVPWQVLDPYTIDFWIGDAIV